MSPKDAGVPMLSDKGGNDKGGNGAAEVIDALELAKRWHVPTSWIRNRTRARTPKDERIPCVRFGRYVRFEWGSARLAEYLERNRQ